MLKQYTEEKFGHADKTELDAHFENLLQRADNTRQWTESILSQTESVLQPNPSTCSLCQQYALALDMQLTLFNWLYKLNHAILFCARFALKI